MIDKIYERAKQYVSGSVLIQEFGDEIDVEITDLGNEWKAVRIKGYIMEAWVIASLSFNPKGTPISDDPEPKELTLSEAWYYLKKQLLKD